MERYILIDFPEIQWFQEQPDFEDHSHVCVDIDGAYFIEEDWVATQLYFTQIQN